MRFRHIAILAVLVVLLSSCSIGSFTIQTAGPEPATQTTAVNIDQATTAPTESEPSPEPSPTVKPLDINNTYIIIVDKEDNAFGIFGSNED